MSEAVCGLKRVAWPGVAVLGPQASRASGWGLWGCGAGWFGHIEAHDSLAEVARALECRKVQGSRSRLSVVVIQGQLQRFGSQLWLKWKRPVGPVQETVLRLLRGARHRGNRAW